MFQFIEVSFLPVGHTHEDIDQMFSRFAIRMHKNNAITVNELIEQFTQAFTPNPIVIHLKNIANMRDYIINNNWMNTIKGKINNKVFIKLNLK